MKIYVFDNFRFDIAKKQLWQDSKVVALQPKVADILAVFLETQGELLNRNELMSKVWKDTFVEESNLRFCIHSLRKTLGKDYIETVPKRGYRFTAEVKEEVEETADSLGRYQLLEKVGVGGMGEVFLAFDPQLERKVALKVLLPQIIEDDERIRRFKLEAKAVSALNHPNIVTIFDIGESKGKLFIAYEFIKGETLREKIRKNKLTVTDSINIAEQVADSLAAAHKAGITHRDIKPENIMIRDDGYLKILDFGLAKRSAFHTTNDAETLEWVKTQKGIIFGSVQYMSPEQSRGMETDEKTDIWSLGVVLYEMLTGKNPFEGETISDSVAAILHFEPQSISQYLNDFPTELGEIIEKALQRDLSLRYQTIEALADDLKKVHHRLSAKILTKRVILDRSQEKTAEYRDGITDEKDTYQKSEPHVQPTGYLNEFVPSRKTKKWSKKWLLLPITVLTALFGIGFFAAYKFLHPFIFPNYYTRFQKIKVTQLTNDGKSSLPAISDDRQWLAFVRETDGKKNLITKNLLTGGEEIISSTSQGKILQPTFAPQSVSGQAPDLFYVQKEDKTNILYNTFQINEKYLAGGTEILPDVDSRISFSPDGDRFAFIRQDEKNKNSSLFTAPLYPSNGGTVKEVLNNKSTGLTKFTNVAWQNEGEEFTILGLTENENGSGTGGVYETTKRGGSGIHGSEEVKWTKNGTSLALMGIGETLNVNSPSGYRGATEINSEIYRFTSFDSTADGKAVVVAVVASRPGLWSFNLKSGENKQILAENVGLGSSFKSGISQMPNGKLLLTKTKSAQSDDIKTINLNNHSFSHSPIQIYSANPDGSDALQLTQGPGDCDDAVTTPDSKFILFHCSHNFDDGIWRINTDGSNLTQLTDKWDANIRVMPDSKTIVFLRYDLAEQLSHLMRVSIDGGEPLPINLENESNNSIIHFEIFDNGKSLAYSSSWINKETSKSVYKLRIASLDKNWISHLTFEKDFNNAEFKISPDNKWIVYPKGNGLFRFPLKSGSDTSPDEQILQTESGWLSDFTWSNDGENILYFFVPDKTNLFLIEDVD